MCRNYDAGQCQEPGCEGRITCHDFVDNRCVLHSYNGRLSMLEDEEDEPRPTEDYAFMLASVRDAVRDAVGEDVDE